MWSHCIALLCSVCCSIPFLTLRLERKDTVGQRTSWSLRQMGKALQPEWGSQSWAPHLCQLGEELWTKAEHLYSELITCCFLFFLPSSHLSECVPFPGTCRPAMNKAQNWKEASVIYYILNQASVSVLIVGFWSWNIIEQKLFFPNK